MNYETVTWIASNFWIRATKWPIQALRLLSAAIV